MRKMFNLIANVYPADSNSKVVQLENVLRKGRFYGKLYLSVPEGRFVLTERYGSFQAYWEMDDSNLSVLFFDSTNLVTNGFIEDFCDQLLAVIKGTRVLD